ncbi:SHOCT domain-containing protein [Sphingobium sp. CAP-1]|uniref:SHOCT domain-containing protein n=1 Tax=Sphingobium sp. CAP-1 TaxID=2676077 RepID=UPI0012BB1D8F|nr:SHOCT domain-containing protein [Sphingobium sp. CAP-1]QGP79588.1 hypothetical protein GL174_11810 [Sphingobium sp. CAP-1]
MNSQLEQLERLARLLDQGALTAEEFQAEKARLLGTGDKKSGAGEASSQPTSAPQQVAPPRPRRGAIVAALVIATTALGGGAAFYYFRQPPAHDAQNRPTPPQREPTALPRLPISPMSEQAALTLDRDIQFSNPSNCQASAATDSLFNRVLTPPNGDVANISSQIIHVGGDRREVRPVLTKTDGSNAGEQIYEGTADFPQPATWHGLRVRGVTASLYVIPEADSTYTRQIRFLDDLATVRAALNKQGFAVPPPPQYSELHDDACGGSMQIVSVPGGSALQCSWGC